MRYAGMESDVIGEEEGIASCRDLIGVSPFRPRPPRLSDQARDGGQAEAEKTKYHPVYPVNPV